MTATRTDDRPAQSDAPGEPTIPQDTTEVTETTEVSQIDLAGNEVAVEDGEAVAEPQVEAVAEAPAEANEAPAKPKKPRASRAKKAVAEPAPGASDENAGAVQPEAEVELVQAAEPVQADEPVEEIAPAAVAADDAPATADAPTADAPTADPATAETAGEDTVATEPIEALAEQATNTPDVTEEPATGTEVAATAAEAAGDTTRASAGDDSSPLTGHDDEPSVSFEDLGLTGHLLQSLKAVGYEAPSPIQVATIPDLLAGRDVIAQAQTGSGKTAAFGLPIIESIDPSQRGVQALILCPTRELAIQVAEALHKYGRHKEVETLPIYGGQAYERQFRGLQRGVQIVVGTPGRVMDHMRRGSLNLESARFFVLDEADEMLDMGFIDDVDWILGQVPADRQMALFSATMPPRIEQLARNHMKDPARISVRGKEVTVPTTTQSAYEVPRSRKVDVLNRILDAEEPTSTMIFCRTKHGVDELGEALQGRGYSVETLHGDLSQAQRDRVMRRFRGGQAEILIATDVAARGLDIPEVSHVINYDIPESTEAYVHRIGRTGRAGRPGEAITLVSPRELRWLRQIERATKGKIDVRRLPTLADVADRRREVMKSLITDTLRDESNYEPYLEVVEQLAEDNDMSAIAAAVLKLYADETGRGAIEDHTEDDLATFGTAQRGRGEQGMTRLFLNIGRAQGIRPQDIVGAIANEANIPGRSIGAIDILDQNTFVDIPTHSVQAVLEAMATIRMKGRPVQAEVSNEAPRTGEFGGRGGDRGGDRGPRGGGFRDDRGPRGGGFRDDRGPRGGGGFRDDRGPRREDRGPRDGRFGFDDRGPRPDRGPREGNFGFNDRGPRRDDRGPRDGGFPADRGPRDGGFPGDRGPRDGGFDRGPRREDRPFGGPGASGRPDDRGPRGNDRGPAPRRFDRDGDRPEPGNERFGRPEPGNDRFERPRRRPGNQAPYRPFHRDDNED